MMTSDEQKKNRAEFRADLFRELLDLVVKSRVQESEEDTTRIVLIGLALLEQTLGDVRRAADALEKIAERERLISERGRW